VTHTEVSAGAHWLRVVPRQEVVGAGYFVRWLELGHINLAHGLHEVYVDEATARLPRQQDLSEVFKHAVWGFWRPHVLDELLNIGQREHSQCVELYELKEIRIAARLQMEGHRVQKEDHFRLREVLQLVRNSFRTFFPLAFQRTFQLAFCLLVRVLVVRLRLLRALMSVSA